MGFLTITYIISILKGYVMFEILFIVWLIISVLGYMTGHGNDK